MKKYKVILLICLVCFPGFWMCSSGHRPDNKDNFEKGTVIPSVACLTDTSIKYSLYLPSGYDPDEKYPVIFAFDPHAKGELPVNLFKDMAEKYGYILIGSNNSQNGLSQEQTMHFYEVMSDDVLGRFSVNRERIYTAGFSGGSRVASSLAIFKGGIAGVIGCSAGFPSLSEAIQFRFDYIGYVGDEDMNYLEMITLQDALSRAGYRHHLVVFKGKHDWPPKSSVPEAFIWMEANAMKDMKKARDNEFIEQTINNWLNQAKALEGEKRLPEAYEKYQQIITFFDGLADMKAYHKKVEELAANADIQAYLQSKSELAKKELALQTRYLKALNEKPAAWWREEVKSLNFRAEKSDSVSLHPMYKRLLGYLSLASYSNANGFLNAGDLTQAGRYIELYSIVDPQNSEHAYLAACLYSKTNQADKAFASLDVALSLGFNDRNRFQADTVLARLKGDSRYGDFLQKLGK